MKSINIKLYKSSLFGMLHWSALIILVIGFIFVSCSKPPVLNPEGPYWLDNDTKPIPEPNYEEPNLMWMTIKRTSFDQLNELLDLDRNIRKLSGNPTQAKNTNSLDEVPNSSWFTNRHGYPATRMTPEEIEAGPSLTPGPDTAHVWHVFRPKVGGTTPGFWIEDSRGHQYIIKFDPPGNPEMATAAAAMGSRYLYACGYNVTQETIVYWRPEMLRIREGATIKDAKGKKRPLTMDDIDKILTSVQFESDGRIRSLASLNIGNVKGPFMYDGTRSDDPNDWCPHEHRRDLRGLYVIGSLINHYDLKDHNSMDVYIGEDGAGYLKHYQMDFGSTFGSDGRRVKPVRKGYANYFDLKDVMINVATMGLKTWPWQYAKPYKFPSIGYFESELFEPNEFDPIFPNPTFEQLTLQDAYWGAKIVMAFSDDDLAALVKSGHLSNPEAEAYLFKTLKERQEKIGRHWFSKVNPLDYPSVEGGADSMQFSFQDLAIEYNLEPNNATYQYEIRHKGNNIVGPTEINSANITLISAQLQSLLAIGDTGLDTDQDRFVYKMRIKTQRVSGNWSKPVVFWLLYGTENKQFRVVGIEHPD